MAEGQDDAEKSEDPTQKRLDEAIARGDVVKSQEVTTWCVLAGAGLVLSAFAGPLSGNLKASLTGIIANAHTVRTDGHSLIALSSKLSLEVAAAMAMPILVLLLAAVAGSMVQHRFVWSAEGLTPKFSKVSPMAGMKRMFSKHALMNFVKGLIKLVLIGTVVTMALWPQRHRLETLTGTDVGALLPFTHALSLSMFGTVIAIMAIVAAADYFFAYRTWFEKQKMSLREIKEEYKQSEGDPTMKGRIRRIRETRMRKRMMAAVPNATVIITNPTHYAVALAYERGDNAPKCVAKGVDTIALKIREVANAHSVPIVENVALARALHATVEIDQEIPADHYKAVAEVIGYVMRLRRGIAR